MRTLGQASLLLVALACLWVAIPDWARFLRMSRWPAVPGKVVYADVRQEKTPGSFRYHADVDVAYTVNGRPLTTRSLRADSHLTSRDRGWADRIVGAYTQEPNVEVRYNPANPAEARVEIWPQPAIWVLCVWAACSLFGFFWMRRRPL